MFDRLRQAKEQYDDETDGGRLAAFTTVGAMWQFIALFSSSQAKLLHVPALNLLNALAALEQNDVLPILKPVARRGRAASSHKYASLHGHIAGTVTRLRESGLDLKQSHAQVAKEMAKLGVRSARATGIVTAKTVSHWCDEVASDVSRLGAAAIMYDSMFTREENNQFQSLAPSEARRFAIASLQTYVRTFFPEFRAAAEKPS